MFENKKLVLTYFTIIIIFVAWLLTAKFEALIATFPSLVGALLAGAGIHSGMDVFEQHVNNIREIKMAAPDEPEQPQDPTK